MRGLEENVQIQPGFVALVLGRKNSGNDGARKAGFAGDKSKSLRGQDAGIGLLRSGSVSDGGLSAPNYGHMGGHGYADRRGKPVQPVAADREPPSGIEQVAGIVAVVSQLQTGHWAVVARFEL